MTQPQEPTREIDMAKLLEDQAELDTASKPDRAAGAEPGEDASGNAAQ